MKHKKCFWSGISGCCGLKLAYCNENRGEQCKFFQPHTHLSEIRCMDEETLQEWYCEGRDCNRCKYLSLGECTFQDWLRESVMPQN